MQKNNVRVEYIKNASYRTIHVDGANGGLTPELNVFVAFWLQRGPIPDATVHEIAENGLFVGTPSETIVKADIIREIEFGLTMNVDVAKQLRDWLADRIKEAEQVRSAGDKELKAK